MSPRIITIVAAVIAAPVFLKIPGSVRRIQSPLEVSGAPARHRENQSPFSETRINDHIARHSETMAHVTFRPRRVAGDGVEN